MEKDLNIICEKIGILIGKVDGINQRLDIANGRTTKLEDRTNCLESEVDNMKGKSIVLGSIAGIIVSVGLLIINYFIK